MFSRSQNMVISGGTFINNENRTSRGMDILMQWVATGAFHNSDELYDAPRCHPRTRVAVLDAIMEWVNESESATRDDFVMWLFGPAGSGKSAIARRIAEIAAERNLLIADFFFSRTSPTRGTKDRLIGTLAYQLTISIPDIRSYIEDAIERDPAIFNRNILTQIETLLIKPFQILSESTQIVPCQRLIIIDGLDECNHSQAQVAILEAISQSFTQHKLPIKFLVASRPEPDLVTSFNCNEPLRSIHRRLALDDTYRPDDDIRLFFSDKFEHIRRTHLLRSTIPITWPTQETLDKLIAKSSGQFIYASTVVKFVESSCYRPTARLNIILGISPPGRTNPFAELDSLYDHILSSVDDIQITLCILGFYAMTPSHLIDDIQSPELFLSLEPGDIQLALINLSSIVAYQELSGEVKILHASLVDFLSDKRRSTIYYIDKASTYTYFVRRILQYVKGPDGIQAGDINLFCGLIQLSPWILKGQLRSEILNFDIDAFINASIRWLYREPRLKSKTTMDTFSIWMEFLNDAGLEDGDKKAALDRLDKCFESRRADILLEMDDHNFHYIDRDALDLRHAYRGPWPKLIGMITSCLDGDLYASAALHCMRFLSNPPTYFDSFGRKEFPKIYIEWKATCHMTLEILCRLLEEANDSPELVQFISNHDIHPAVRKAFSADRVLPVTVHILAFLSRSSVCPNWMIVSAIQQSLIIIRRQPSQYMAFVEEGEWDPFNQERLDQCCSNRNHSS